MAHVTVGGDVPIARQEGKIIGELNSKGVTAGINDAIIAATVLQVSDPWLTNKVEHYALTDLRAIRACETQDLDGEFK